MARQVGPGSDRLRSATRFERARVDRAPDPQIPSGTEGEALVKVRIYGCNPYLFGRIVVGLAMRGRPYMADRQRRTGEPEGSLRDPP